MNSEPFLTVNTPRSKLQYEQKMFNTNKANNNGGYYKAIMFQVWFGAA